MLNFNWDDEEKKKKSKLEEMQNKINNSETKLGSVGVDAKPKQSWLGKKLNLDPKNNWFFDTLDIIDRPRNAVANIIKNVHSGKQGIGESLTKGLSGKEHTSGSDILDEYGWKKTKENSEPNKIQNILGKSGALGIFPMIDKETRTARGMASFGVDMLTDPLNVLGAGAESKGAKAISGVVKKTAGKLDEATDAIKPLYEAKSKLGSMFNRTHGLNKNLDGKIDESYLDEFNQIEKDSKFQHAKLNEHIDQNTKLLNSMDEGKDVARIVEAPLEQKKSVEAWMMPDGTVTKNFDDVKAIQSELKQNVLDKTKAIKNLDTEHNKITKELNASISSIDKQLRNIEKEAEKTVRRSNTITSLDDTAEVKNTNGFIKNAVNEMKIPSMVKSSLKQNKDYQNLMRQRMTIQNELTKQGLKTDSLRKQMLSELDAHKLDHEAFSALKKTEPNHSLEEVIPRERLGTLSEDPNINQAAKNVDDFNKELLQYANDSGVPVTGQEGYMKHTLTDNGAEWMKLNNKGNDANFQNGANPKKSVYGERNVEKFHGSAEEINARRIKEGKDPLFEENALTATAKGAEKMINVVDTHRKITSLLKNKNFARKVEGSVSPEYLKKNPHMDVLTVSEIKDLLTDPETGKTIVNSLGDGSYYVPKQVKKMLINSKKIETNDGKKALFELYKKTTDVWKKFALFSPGFHARNGIGMVNNMYMGGMNPTSIAKHIGVGTEELHNLQNTILPKVYKGEKLTESESEALNRYRRFQKEGLLDTSSLSHEFFKEGVEKTINRKINYQNKSGLGKIAEKLKTPFESSRDLGINMDTTGRYAMFNWAYEKAIKQGLSEAEAMKNASKKVKEALFDYSDLSKAEAETIKHIIPFYSFMRKNLEFQMKNFMTPTKWGRINGTNNFVQEQYKNHDMNPNTDVYGNYKEDMDIPIGKQKLLNANLPLSDVNRMFSDPTGTLFQSVNAIPKSLAEYATNLNFYTGKKLKEFEGQKKNLHIPLANKDIPLDPKLAHLLENMGPMRNFMQDGGKTKDESSASDSKLSKLITDLSLGLIKDVDKGKVSVSKAYDEEKRLGDLLKKYEQDTGMDVPTINELKKEEKDLGSIHLLQKVSNKKKKKYTKKQYSFNTDK